MPSTAIAQLGIDGETREGYLSLEAFIDEVMTLFSQPPTPPEILVNRVAFLRRADPHLPARARALIQIGEVGIAREDHAALERFFDPDFQFHGPAGAELNRLQLWQYFAACRAAFDEFSVIRQMLMSDGHDYIAARTRFSGVFARTFAAQPDAPIQPNGKRLAYSLINISRYTADGRLAEEWAQYDTGTFMDQLTS
ncbi:ester cyclase [Sphingomonas carotinifaciens]|uniref:ester cyclase n=1 Tax=Sphingomonas carotinifaciens TaxID=1166323 RepID=UPI0013750784|nr:ester cyclase [Sphingomonas carotinifaciens]